MSPVQQRRVYGCTFRAWCKFADEQGFSTDDVSYGHVRAFIYEADVAKTTRQNRLSHMHKVLEALAIADRERYEQHYQAVKSFLKVKMEESDRERPERAKRALKPHEVTRLLDVWRDDRSIQGLRNNAMIRILVYIGLRRSELVALRWSDVPTSDEVVALVVDKTASSAGLGKLAPHDLRRTLITACLESGGHLRDLQDQAGHANAATTLRYAQASDAQARRKIRLPFA